MKIVLFAHSDSLGSVSMPHFASMIFNGMSARGHQVEVWKPGNVFYKLPAPQNFKKWLGYLDQFLIFPIQVACRLRSKPVDTLFVFSDQALGPWVPLVKHRPNVIHCHDFLALRSAMGEIPECRTGWTGRIYQQLIRLGFSCGEYFISVSANTQRDLQRLILSRPSVSGVVYNGLNYCYRPMPTDDARKILSTRSEEGRTENFLLHVGGNQWYKNRSGVLRLYHAYCEVTEQPLPLLMIGATPTAELTAAAAEVKGTGRVKFLTNVGNEVLRAAYSLAALLIFPSKGEGFGWPILEGMACGCLVMTTNEAPMTEVGGEAAYYIPREQSAAGISWARSGAKTIIDILSQSASARKHRQELCLQQAARFSSQSTLDSYERIYSQVLDAHLGATGHAHS